MNTEKLFCYGCNRDVTEPSVEQVEHANGVMHLKASCDKCGRYLKYLSQGKPAALYFGKYSGKLVSDVAREDPEYLRWLYAQTFTKTNLKKQIDEALSAL